MIKGKRGVFMRKLVLITGVTKGLGRAMVDQFDEAGWTVIGCGRSEKKIKELQEQYKGRHAFWTADVSDDKSIAAWATEVHTRFGFPNLLINNASIVNRIAPVWEVSPEEFAQVMSINVNGSVNVLRAFVPGMLLEGSGVILNISSSWGRSAEAGLAPYCASKFAIEGLTQSLASELPLGMAAISLDPGGSISTPMLHACGPEYVDSSPTPEEWAKSAVPYILGLGVEDNGKALTFPCR
ncbi:SDR family NAD(P)-dependent oxidoreductase [Bacillus haimaensis]|uniref:SDR family oxidoreductase n=1 Tax=Bacillus haimaensis TaxID=3160967 RepID=UPI003AA8CCAF